MYYSYPTIIFVPQYKFALARMPCGITLGQHKLHPMILQPKHFLGEDDFF